MSMPENVRQITEAAEALVATTDIQANCIAPEEQLKEQERRIVFHDDAPDKTELVLGNEFEVKVEDGKTFVVRKDTAYPKTYGECNKILGYIHGNIFFYTGNLESERDEKLLNVLGTFRELLICRDAYWKLAGDWKPDHSLTKYIITTTSEGDIFKGVTTMYNYVLAFPSNMMRDAFYTNFKDLIEACKELI